MDYIVLTEKDQADIVRRHILQAEADYFNHKLNAVKARAVEDENSAKQYDTLAEKASSDIVVLKEFASATQPELQKALEPALPKPAEVPADAVPTEEPVAEPAAAEAKS